MLPAPFPTFWNIHLPQEETKMEQPEVKERWWVLHEHISHGRKHPSVWGQLNRVPAVTNQRAEYLWGNRRAESWWTHPHGCFEALTQHAPSVNPKAIKSFQLESNDILFKKSSEKCLSSLRDEHTKERWSLLILPFALGAKNSIWIIYNAWLIWAMNSHQVLLCKR